MNNKNLLNQLKIAYPIIQAPMAGITTPNLVAAVSNAGGLGTIGAGYLSPVATKEFVSQVKEMTSKPFGINLFVPENNDVSEDIINRSIQLLEPFRKELHLDSLKLSKVDMNDTYEKQLEIIMEEKVEICSFTFGVPSHEVIKELKKNGTTVIGTATTVDEAKIIESLEMDAVVVQGSEAGGHRGTFLKNESYIGLMSLIPQVVDELHIPVIAAGGIMDGRGLVASICLGAEAAQLGTAFLTTEESGAHLLHKQAILQATEEETQFTKAFSGKTARGIANQFIKSMEAYDLELPAYPFQNSLTKEIRQEAAKQSNKEFMSLWAGQSTRLSKEITVQELIHSIVVQARSIYPI